MCGYPHVLRLVANSPREIGHQMQAPYVRTTKFLNRQGHGHAYARIVLTVRQLRLKQLLLLYLVPRVIDCKEACKVSKDWFPLPPAANSICQGKSEEISQEQTLTCTDDCGECPTTKSQKVTVVGTKETNTCAECTLVTKSDWSTCPASESMEKPAPQSKTSRRDCRNVDCQPQSCPDETEHKDCPWCEGEGKKLENDKCFCDSDQRFYRTGKNKCTKCPADKEFKLDNGTWRCAGCLDGQVLDTKGNCVCPDGQTLVNGSCCNTTCAAGCNGWDNWSSWSSTDSCPANDKFTKPASIEQTRDRSRTCDNLCTNITCFTSNNETNIVTCEYCQGEGQELLEDGTCICDHKKGYYKDGNACALCKAPQLLKQSGSTYVCVDPPTCSDCMATSCSEWTKGSYTASSERPENVCAGTNFTATYTETRTCTNCPCETTRETPYTEVGTNDTAWENWSAWSPLCPEDAATKMQKTTVQQSRTGTCSAHCLDPDTSKCPNEKEELRGLDCPYCEGKGQLKQDGTDTCICDAANGYTLSGDECICNTAARYYLDAATNTCTHCPTTSVFDASTGTCCPEGQELNDAGNACVPICPERQTRNTEDVCVCTDTGEPPDENGKCITEANCSKCDPFLNKWQTTQHCPSKASFKEHTVEKKRQRSRTCPDSVMNEINENRLACALVQIETEFCPWCQGEGQEIDGDGLCVCDTDANYYLDGNKCKLCMGKGKIIDKGNCVCDRTTYHYLGTNNEVCKVCPEDKQVNVDGTGCVCTDSERDACNRKSNRKFNDISCKCECSKTCADDYVINDDCSQCVPRWNISSAPVNATVTCLNAVMSETSIANLQEYWDYSKSSFPEKDMATEAIVDENYTGYSCATLQSFFNKNNYHTYYHQVVSSELQGVLEDRANKISNITSPCHDENCPATGCATDACTVPAAPSNTTHEDN